MILLMGIQGSGKGTQGALLAEKCGYTMLSMGDIIRAEVSDEQRERMLQGFLVSDEETTVMIDRALSKIDSQHCILDGYPRSIYQVEWLFSQADAGRFSIDHIFYLTASREAMKARLLARGRIDDNEAAIDKRFAQYEQATAPLLDWFAEHGKTVERIDAERSIEAVHQDLVAIVSNDHDRKLA